MSLKIEIIDDFLDKEDLNSLQNLKLKNTPDGKMNVYVKKIDKADKISGSGIEDETALKFQKSYHDKAMKLLRKLNSEKADLYEYSEFGITDTVQTIIFQFITIRQINYLVALFFFRQKKVRVQNFIKIKKGMERIQLNGK